MSISAVSRSGGSEFHSAASGGKDLDALAWSFVDFRESKNPSAQSIKALRDSIHANFPKLKSNNQGEQAEAREQLAEIIALSLALSDGDGNSGGLVSGTDIAVQNSEKLLKVCNDVSRSSDLVDWTYDGLQAAMRRINIDEYMGLPAVAVAIENGEPLPLPTMPTNVLPKDANHGITLAEEQRIRESGAVIEKRLEETFAKAGTNVSFADGNRKITNMTGSYNTCGWASVLSQTDSTCGKMNLAPGSNLAKTPAVIAAESKLRFISAVNEVNSNNRRESTTAHAIREQLNKSTGKRETAGESHGMFSDGNKDYMAIAKASGKKVLSISEDNQRNLHLVLYDGQDDQNGEEHAMITVANFPVPSVDDCRGILPRTQALLADPDTIVMYHSPSTTHFMSVLSVEKPASS
jgi:hypothetical protein